ncbi:hypothetical protein ACIBO2_49530 [Nonomuraea sp. NPDC050022]|uniref:hypothetical protein n=1 Tax=Nonomuraea sp. NPDC050022 TaxID=3364358 RepID=UPI0037B1D7D7
MEETFKRSFSPRRVRFGYKSDSDIRLLYASLLNAELSGDLSGVTRVRQTFGNVLALALSNGTTHSGSNAEAIRLLRQGDAQDHLRSFLRELRAQGQLDIIRQSAEDLIAARSLQDFVTASDLVLLEHSADLVPLDFTSRALAMPFIYVQTSRDGRVAGSVVSRSGKIETTLKLLSTLTSGLEEVDMSYVAASTLNLVRDSIQLINQPLFTTIARLVQKIDWMTVPASTKSDWLVFLESAGFSSAQVLAIDRLRAFAALEVSPPKSVRKMLRGDEFVAALIEELLGDPPAQGDLEKAVEIVSAQVDEIQHDAEHGKVMGYIWSPFELAAFLIAKYSRDDMWATLLPGLEHPLVMAASKVDALRVLTNHAVRTTLPEDVREHLTRARLPTPPDMRQTRLYPVTAEQFEAACRNFYLAYGLIGPDHAQADVLRDAGSREIGARQEAALSCLQIAARNPDVEWSAILLLQLSHDYESGVRNRASYALAYLSLLPDVALIDKIKTRVRTLLAEPGIAIVSGVLRGLMDACEVYKPLPEHFWCRDIVGELAENHTSRFVQRTAKDILERAAGMRDSR